MLVLDTDHLSLLEWGASEEGRRLKARLLLCHPAEVVTTIISFEEQTRGWLSFLARGRSLTHQVEAYRRLKKHLDTYRRIPVLDFEEKAAAEFHQLERLRIRIGTFDLKIAAIALAQDSTLLSRNLGDFRKVPGLSVEDWTA